MRGVYARTTGETREMGQTVTHMVIFESSEFTQQTKEKESPSPLWLGKVKTRNILSLLLSSITSLQTYHNLLLLLQKSGSSSYSGRRSIVFDDGDRNIRDCMLSFTKEEVLDGDERPVS